MIACSVWSIVRSVTVVGGDGMPKGADGVGQSGWKYVSVLM